jgi:hypothetical protein
VATDDYDARYLEGIRWFNQQEFFEAHEVWEDVWRDNPGASHKFYQGLIQVAVCLHHFRRGNTRGARKLYKSSTAYLDRYRPTYQGLDIQQLFDQLERCCREIATSEETFPSGKYDPSLAPKIKLASPS